MLSTSFQPLQLITMQLELECIAVEQNHLLVRVPCPNPDDLPRVLVAKSDASYRLFIDHNLPQNIRHSLEQLAPQQAFVDPTAVRSIFGQDQPYDEPQSFRSYIFPNTLSPTYYPDALRLPEPTSIGTPVFGIASDEYIISACTSSRENAKCAEAWVWTEASFQRRGYARQVVNAWAHDLQLQHKYPFYSHKITNLASAAVARSLGLIPFVTTIIYP